MADIFTMEGTGTQQPDSLITNYQNKKYNKKPTQSHLFNHKMTRVLLSLESSYLLTIFRIRTEHQRLNGHMHTKLKVLQQYVHVSKNLKLQSTYNNILLSTAQKGLFQAWMKQH